MSSPAASSIERIEQLARELDAWGCTPDEIAVVRHDQGLALPRSYETFLRHLGRDGGGLFGGTAVCYPEIVGLRRAAVQVLDEYRQWKTGCEVFVLPEDAVVISMHQGYAFQFVRASLGDDPPVEWWAEGTQHPEQPSIDAASIAEWLEAEASSSVLPPEQRRSHRLATQAGRRRSFERERCPSCGGELVWGALVYFAAGDPNSGREQARALCQGEGRSYWRWADESRTPLRPVVGA